MRFFIFTFLVLLAAVLLIYPALAQEFSSTNFRVLDPVLESGAGFGTSSGFQLYTSIGGEAIGLSDSAGFILKGGFLYFPAPAPAAPSPEAPLGAGVGTVILRLTEIEKIEALRICDFNGDGECDIIDLSIVLFYYNGEGSAVARYDLNGNGRVDFTDISILFYYWTALA